MDIVATFAAFRDPVDDKAADTLAQVYSGQEITGVDARERRDWLNLFPVLTPRVPDTYAASTQASEPPTVEVYQT